MKQVVILIALGLVGSSAQAQTTEEWFSQPNTQTKYLIQQIVALQGYLGHVNKGYTIAQKGIKTIRSIKDGEWKLHSGFINSKDAINLTVKNYIKIADIIALQDKIGQKYKTSFQLLKSSDLFINSEVDYLYQVFATLLHDCAGDINELTLVITPGKWKMNDEERLQRINQLYISMLDKYLFVQDFTKDVQILAGQRMKEKKSVHTSHLLHHLKSE